MRVLALDVGEKRVGVAVSDESGRIALPLEVLDARALGGDLRELRALIERYDVTMLLAGLPRSLDGSSGPHARDVQDRASQVASTLGLPLEFADERLTSAEAARAAGELGLDERARRGRLDAAAAAIMLQAWLDARSRSGP